MRSSIAARVGILVLLAITVVTGAGFLTGRPVSAANAPRKLTIICTADTLGYLDPCG